MTTHKRPSKETTAGGFRLCRAFTVEHNAARLRKYCDRLGRSADIGAFRLRLRIKRRCRAGGAQA